MSAPHRLWVALATVLCIQLCVVPCTLANANPDVREISGLHLAAIDVQTARWSPDGQYLVYFVDMDLDGVTELHSARASGPFEAPEVLSIGPFSQPYYSPNLVFSPDSQYVLSRKFSEQGAHVVSIPVAGGTELDLFGPRETLSVPVVDSSGQVYVISRDNDGQGIFRVPVTGGTPVRMSPAPPGSLLLVAPLRLSPDETRLAYTRRLNAGSIQLVTLPTSGGSPVVVNSPISFPEKITSVFYTPDGSHLVYVTQGVDAPQFRLHAAPVDGPTSVQLQSSTTLGHVKISADSARVVFTRVWQWPQLELVSVPIGGGVATRIVDTEDDGLQPIQYEVSDSANNLVLFTAGGDLYSTPITGGGVFTKISAVLAPTGQIGEFQMSPDGTLAIYRGDAALAGRQDLYGVPVAGGTVVRYNDPAVDSANVDDFLVADGQVYFERSDRIVAAPLAGGPETVLSAEPIFGGGIEQLLPSPDGQQMAYISRELSTAARELFEVSATGGDVTRRSRVPRQVAGHVSHYQVNKDGEFVVFRADRDTYELPELYSVKLADDSVVKLNPPLPLNLEVAEDFQIHGAEVYFRSERTFRVFDLYRAPLEATSAKGAVQAELLSDGAQDVENFVIDQDRVVYLASGRISQVPMVGGVPTRLDSFDGDILSFSLSLDRSLILFVGDDSPTISGLNLFVMPATGGAPTVLGGTLASSTSLTRYKISPDNEWVAYAVDGSTDRLQTVRVDGSDHRVHSRPVIFDFTFTQDSSHVLVGGGSLWTFPVGTDDISVISSPATVYGFAGTWQLTAQDRVVFQALSEGANSADQVMSVPRSGGELEELSAPMLGAPIEGFHVSPDGTSVVIESTPEGEASVLHANRTAGGTATALTAGQGATPLGFTEDGSLSLLASAALPLGAEPFPAGAPIALAPADFTGVAVEAKHAPQSEGVIFTAAHHDRRTALHFSSLGSLLLIDGFETGDTSRWDLTVP